MMTTKKTSVAPDRLMHQFRWRLLLIVGLTFLVIVSQLAGAIFLFVQQQREQEQSLVLQQELDTLLSAMIDQETGLRGYTVTREATFLQPFEQGHWQYIRLFPLVRAGFHQLKLSQSWSALDRVQATTTAWYNTFAYVQLQLFKTGKGPLPRIPANQLLGKALFDQFRQAMADLQHTFVVELATHRVQQRTITLFVLLADLVLASGVVWFIWWLLAHVENQLQGQLESLQAAARSFSAGDLQVRVPPLRHRELRVVGDTLNGMAQALQEHQDELEARALLLERASEYWALLNAVNTAMIFISAEERIVVLNQSFMSFFDVAEERLLGRGLDTLFFFWEPLLVENQTLQLQMRRSLQEQRRQEEILELVQLYPRRRELELQSFPVSDGEHHYLGQLFLLRDVTSERDLDRAKSEFIATISHEFRTALTGIEGFSELICKQVKTMDEAKNFASDILTDAQRLTRLITNLVDLERLRTEPSALHLERVQVNTCLRKAVERMQPATAEHSLDLQLDPAAPEIEGDTEKLVQVVQVLISNAVAYSQPGTAILLTSQLNGDQVQLTVQDHGKGIPEEELEHIFEPYSRIHRKHTRYVEGMGLGLSFAHLIVQMHHGRIWAESTPGQGATFHVTLPLVVRAANEIYDHSLT
ncbi:MAG: CHASE3 domain-containing protein [Ktedonobacteraceae bacterium]|nr:CHASE3 domain-containing protein [Ktedonobacteraceae bacterium]